MADIGDELEPLIFRLVGDDSDYKKMWEEAVAEAKKSTEEIESLSAKIEGVGKQMSDFGSRVAAGFAAAGLAHFLDQSIEVFTQFEETTIKLNAILEINGR